jgi:hypothetical protein
VDPETGGLVMAGGPDRLHIPAGPLFHFIPAGPFHYGPFDCRLTLSMGWRVRSITFEAEAWPMTSWTRGALLSAYSGKVKRNSELADYEYMILKVVITFGDETYTTYARVNVPIDLTTGDLYSFGSDAPAVVLFMSGTAGDAVTGTAEQFTGSTTISTDDEMAAVLATGSVSVLSGGGSFGRGGEPAFTVVFNRPTRGGGSYVASAIPEYRGWGPDNDGDDDGGAYTSMFTEAVAECALACIEARLSGAGIDTTPRLFVASFSNGLAAASRWLRWTSKTVRAVVDVEGPTDSLEQTVSTICYDPFGMAARAGATTLGTTFDLAAWQDAYAGETALCALTQPAGGRWPAEAVRRDKFLAAWRLMFRPPVEVLAEMEASHWWSPSDVPLPDSIATMPDDYRSYYWKRRSNPAFFDHIREYWEDRNAETHLQHRPCPYIRANGRFDHVQSIHYHNRHAARALVAAGNATSWGTPDVYLADQTYYEAVRAGTTPDPTALSSLGTIDVDHHRTFPTWPIYYDTTGDRAHVEVDLIRWAIERFT